MDVYGQLWKDAYSSKVVAKKKRGISHPPTHTYTHSWLKDVSSHPPPLSASAQEEKGKHTPD